MDSQPTNPPQPSRNDLWAYLGPFGLFSIFLMAVGAVKYLGGWFTSPPLWLTAPEHWLYPLQTLLCGVALVYWRRHYPMEIGWRSAAFGALVGVVVFFIWVAPQEFLGWAPRTEGFDPTRHPWRQSAFVDVELVVLSMRFIRLVAVVPVMEEIFWRGFLLRYLVREDFARVPFGTFTRLSFGVVALGFMLEHSSADYPAALIAGVLYNLVAVRTKCLAACIMAHALTNLLLGIYIMYTRQWGFW